MNKNNNYKILAITLTISLVIMYLVMFLNVTDFNHIYLSYTRLYMAILMVSPMALLMIFMMKDMFNNKIKNISIVTGSIIIFFSALILLRTQTPIKDVQYMKAMIPHHSSAILTSENAVLEDPEVKELAAAIIKAQKKEIEEMKGLIEKLD